jgi:DNA mismatch repair protein MutS2
LDELRRGRGGQAAPRTAASSRPDWRAAEPQAAAASTELSLRGLRIDEAEPLLAKALDDAVLAELPYLRVIHGKGTGAMRQFVHEVLAADPRVKRFGFAPATQGGHGVTVVEFTA